MSTPAAERALALPEILNLILDVANLDRRSLASASLVNSRWYEPATDGLWSEQSSIRPLLQVSSERRQNLARKIVFLSLSERDVILLDRFADPQLISLRTLRVDSRRTDAYCWEPGWFTYRIVPYLQRDLESLSLHGPFGQKNLLRSIANRCPRIHSLSFNAADTCGLAELLHLLRQLEFLKFLSLDFFDTTDGDDVFKCLAGRTCITRLVLSTVEISASAMAEVASLANLSTPLFPKLDVLRLSIGVGALPMLPLIIGSVRGLNLELPDRDIIGTMQHLSTLSNLEALHLTFAFGTGMPPLSTHRVARVPNIRPGNPTDTTCFPKLRRFHLCSKDYYLDKFRDEHLEAIYKHMPMLEDLFVSFRAASFTSSTLISLGERCKFLIECQIQSGFFDLGVLDPIDPPLFPCLRLLGLDCVTLCEYSPGGRTRRDRPADYSPSHPDVLQTVARVTFHAPNIRTLALGAMPDMGFCDAVKSVLREMLEKGGNLPIERPYSLGVLDEAI